MGKCNWTKEQRAAYDKQRYEDNKASIYQQKQDRIQRHRLWFSELKSNMVCSICGENHPKCIEFHHRNPSEKEGNISEMLGWSKKRILAEIDKCDILCANCHRKAHG